MRGRQEPRRNRVMCGLTDAMYTKLQGLVAEHPEMTVEGYVRQIVESFLINQRSQRYTRPAYTYDDREAVEDLADV